MLSMGIEHIACAMLDARLAAAGWRHVAAGGPDDVHLLAAGHLPSLIVLGPDGGCGAFESTVAALRAADGPLAAIPLIVILPSMGLQPGAESAADASIARPATADALVAAIAPWHPAGLLAGVRRLEAHFGRDAIAAMITGFRQQLAKAIERHGRSRDAGLAHRIAGLAGTLGFAAVGASWLALSEGDESAWGDARREARKAIAAIDRDAIGRR